LPLDDLNLNGGWRCGRSQRKEKGYLIESYG
jgi:hypothetical protein